MAAFSGAAFSQAAFSPNAFDFGAAVVAETTRVGGGLSPTKEEWEYYLKRWHELRREEAALKAARKGIKAVLREQMFPVTPQKIRVLERVLQKPLEPQTVTRLPKAATVDNTEIRNQIAELLKDIRKRTQVIKKARAKKRRQRRDEEALMYLI